MTTHVTLVVSPDPGLVNQVRGAIECFGLGVEVVPSAEDALEWLTRQTALLVVAEVDLPGQTGYELCRRVKGENGAGASLLLVHREGDVRAEEECAAAGADGTLGRPFLLHQLEDQLRSLVPDPLPPFPDPETGGDASLSVEVSIDDPSFDSFESSLDGSLGGLGSLDSDSIRTMDTAEIAAARGAQKGGEALGPGRLGRPEPNAFLPPDPSTTDAAFDPVREAVARQFESLQAEGGLLDERIQSAVQGALRQAIESAAPDIAREVVRLIREGEEGGEGGEGGEG